VRVKRNSAELVVAARRGDREATDRLIRRELPWVRGVIAGYLGRSDAVDDLCQEVFLSAWQGLGSLRSASGFRAWLYRIVLNKVRSYLRRRRKSSSVPLPEEIPVEAGEDSEESQDMREAVKEALSRLPSEYRDPLIIHYLQGKSTAETAEILGLRPVTARIRLLRGRRRLAEILHKEDLC